MSSIVVFAIKDNMNYLEMVQLSEKVISYCLKRKLGSIFNFLGYGEKLINDLSPRFYFSISDDFIQLNSEYLTTENIECINAPKGKMIFCKKFSFFDEIHKILIDSNITNVLLLLSCDGSANVIEDYKTIRKGEKTIVETLYEAIINEKDTYAYDFPSVIIQL